MSRIFNIYFDYDGEQYSAMVSVRATPFFIEYTLNNFDDQLTRMLPGNKIISTSAGRFVFQHTHSSDETILMKTILKAVAIHMKSTTV